MIRPHLRDMINNHKAPLEGSLGNDKNLHGEWKIQLTRQINFASSLDPGEIHIENSKRKGESYIESPKWLRNKGATINPINKNDNNCFQYAITTALNYQNIEKNPEKISNIKPFIDQYNWRDIDFPPHQKD